MPYSYDSSYGSFTYIITQTWYHMDFNYVKCKCRSAYGFWAILLPIQYFYLPCQINFNEQKKMTCFWLHIAYVHIVQHRKITTCYEFVFCFVTYTEMGWYSRECHVICNAINKNLLFFYGILLSFEYLKILLEYKTEQFKNTCAECNVCKIDPRMYWCNERQTFIVTNLNANVIVTDDCE